MTDEMALTRHIVIGMGRLGRNMATYAEALGVSVDRLTRRDIQVSDDLLKNRFDGARVIALATPDDVLEDLAARIVGLSSGAQIVQFSGANRIPGAVSCHPLYSFPDGQLPFATMKQIPFALEPDGPDFAQLYPGASNPTFRVRHEDRAFYHATAVLAGNFAAHIWNEVAPAFQARFPDAPADVLAHYLEGCVERFRENPADSMTGPVARRDERTVAVNLKSLEGAPRLVALYRAFLSSAWEDYREFAETVD